jgi:CheY-like chemotaxis protein
MGRSVLFIDDSSFARVSTQARLRKLGIGVTVLASAREAAELEGKSFCAALLDLELDDGLGTEIATRLRESDPALPIAFLTAGGAEATVEAARALGPIFSKVGGVDDAIRWVEETWTSRVGDRDEGDGD